MVSGLSNGIEQSGPSPCNLRQETLLVKSFNDIVVSWPNWVVVKHRAAIVWNSLPDTIKQLEYPLSFKRKINSLKTNARDNSFQKECSVNYVNKPEFRYF